MKHRRRTQLRNTISKDKAMKPLQQIVLRYLITVMSQIDYFSAYIYIRACYSDSGLMILRFGLQGDSL